MILRHNVEKCTGCRLCAIACSGQRIGAFSDTLANIGIHSYYRGDSLITMAHLCDQCGSCISNCPQEALSLENGVVVLSRDKCSSCGLCAESCPNHVIYMWEEYPVLCNLCENDPWCVKMCPKEALEVLEVNR